MIVKARDSERLQSTRSPSLRWPNPQGPPSKSGAAISAVKSSHLIACPRKPPAAARRFPELRAFLIKIPRPRAYRSIESWWWLRWCCIHNFVMSKDPGAYVQVWAAFAPRSACPVAYCFRLSPELTTPRSPRPRWRVSCGFRECVPPRIRRRAQGGCASVLGASFGCARVGDRSETTAQ